MKTIWTVLSVIAVANLMALLAFVGWLGATNRLDAGRVRDVRTMLARTIRDEHAAAEAVKAKEEAERKEAEEKAKAALPPVAASDTLELKLEQSKADQERMEAMKRDVRLLQDTLKRERMQLDEEWKALKKAQADFQLARETVAKTEGNAQFKKTLATYEGLKPDKAKTALQQLIDQKQVDQVVAYLNAMQERTRTKVIDEFIKSDPKVATDLLERLRVRGQIARGPEVPAG